MSKKIEIGHIGNYYGRLSVIKLDDGKCYWSIENHDGDHWEEISENLYKELLKHNKKLGIKE
jgi:hypothetical protein